MHRHHAGAGPGLDLVSFLPLLGEVETVFLNIRDLPELFFLDRFGPELKSVTLSRSLAGASIFSSEPVKVLLHDFHEEGSGSGSFSKRGRGKGIKHKEGH